MLDWHNPGTHIPAIRLSRHDPTAFQGPSSPLLSLVADCLEINVSILFRHCTGGE